MKLAERVQRLREERDEEKKMDASPEHMKNEAELFKRVTKDLGDVKRMATDRLESSIEPTQKHQSQYKRILDLSSELEDVMKQHVAAYD